MSLKKFIKVWLSIASMGLFASLLTGGTKLSGSAYTAMALGDINLAVFAIYSVLLIAVFYIVPLFTTSRWHNIDSNGKFHLRGK